MTHSNLSFTSQQEHVKCPSCGVSMARSLQVRGATLKPYPEGILTCCNPTCRLVLDTNTGIQYRKGKKINAS